MGLIASFFPALPITMPVRMEIGAESLTSAFDQER